MTDFDIYPSLIFSKQTSESQNRYYTKPRENTNTILKYFNEAPQYNIHNFKEDIGKFLSNPAILNLSLATCRETCVVTTNRNGEAFKLLFMHEPVGHIYKIRMDESEKRLEELNLYVNGIFNTGKHFFPYYDKFNGRNCVLVVSNYQSKGFESLLLYLVAMCRGVNLDTETLFKHSLNLASKLGSTQAYMTGFSFKLFEYLKKDHPNYLPNSIFKEKYEPEKVNGVATALENTIKCGYGKVFEEVNKAFKTSGITETDPIFTGWIDNNFLTMAQLKAHFKKTYNWIGE